MSRMSRVITITKTRATLLGSAALIALASSALIVPNAGDAQAAPAQAAVSTPVTVGIQTISTQTVQTWTEFSGRMEAVDFAAIRPEVGGRITEVRIHDGQTVNKGDVLFVIDPRPYEATLAKAVASLEAAKANAVFARTEFARAANLIKGQAIAQQVYDQRANAEQVAAAAVHSAEAEVQQAQIDLDHAFVKAPIAGRISRPEITLGNLVQPGPNAPMLTSIVSSNGIYAAFDVDEQTYLKSVRGQDNTADKLRHMPVQLTLQGDGAHAYQGTVYSFDNRINPTTGTIRARARFDNQDGSLVPGMFVSVRLANTDTAPALLVADRAIANDQSKKYVFVVGEDNKVAYREVTVGQVVGAQHIVLGGLNNGDRVIVDGQQQVRPDQVVTIDPARNFHPQ